MPISPFLLAVATPPAEQTKEAVRQMSTLLLIVSVVGVLLITAAVLLFVLRRNRHAQQDLDRRTNKPTSKASAWHAAGARAEPIDPDPDLPSDDDLSPPDDDPNPNDDTDMWDLPDRSS